MRRKTCDILVLGAGFAGSLVAIIARKIGLTVALIERDRHPRFAIGESSTPLANFKLAALARTYDLPWLAPFAKYGSWKQAYPEIACGLKRGFSFFRHAPGQPFHLSTDHENELLVAANPSAELGDTHWFRADFDTHMVEQAQAAGVYYVDRCDVSAIEHDGVWHVTGITPDEAIDVSATFIVDATGEGATLPRALRIEQSSVGFATSSRGLYGHFTNVQPWSEILSESGSALGDHPFPCDASALHHLIDGGWMWQLRFDNGITSAGFSLDPAQYPLDQSVTPDEEWNGLLAQYPSILQQFEHAALVQPLVRTGRMQRRLSRAVGEDWVALPHTVGFVDPWLSSGIAMTLYGVERIARLLADFAQMISSKSIRGSAEFARRLRAYEQSLSREVAMMDRVSAACFARFDCFPVVAATTMVYFAAVTFAEERFRRGEGVPEDEFLLTHDDRFVSIAEDICGRARSVVPADADAFTRHVARAIEPYNTIGLCDPAARNMYRYV